MKQRVLLQTAMVLLAGLLPLWPAALPALVALVVALALFGPRTGGSLLNWDTPLPWAMLLYVWHVAGMGWSEDQGFGWFDLGIKASLLLLPLVACSIILRYLWLMVLVLVHKLLCRGALANENTQ